MSRLNFQLVAEAAGSAARAATFRALHGEVRTPVFMPVGTQATVRGARVDELKALGAQVLLANTYHLLLRPGPDVFRKFGGIHKFMNWDGPVLTDSGGFQIFSLPGSREMTEAGAAFRSYVDGRQILLSPELSIETQRAIGSDIMMVLDECVPSTCDKDRAAQAMHLTHRWAARSLAARGDSPQSLFAIVQGACYADLRRESAACLTEMPFDGFAIGGLAVGETKDEREEFCGMTAALLPKHLPRYLMGVGTPIDLLEAVHRGVDMFDCILPSALAQQGTAFTHQGIKRFRRGFYKMSETPIDERCGCATCQRFSQAYVHHLVKANEGLGWHLLAVHNFFFYTELMAEMRGHILANTFADYYQEKRRYLALHDAVADTTPPRVRENKKALALGKFEIRLTATGHGRIHDAGSGEGMHPMGSPDDEAEALYVGGSALAERVKAGPVVIWDVGLGVAHNAMAAIRAIEAAAADGPIHPVTMVSFETDLDALRLGLRHIPKFPHLRHAAPVALAREGTWTSPKAPFTWVLLEGDAMTRMAEAAPPDVIFFDPFSYKTDSDLWTVAAFSHVLASCAERETELFTYSTSTAVRAAMLAAGFYVASAPGVGTREESTVALTEKAWRRAARQGLDGRWLARWERSWARVPYGTAPEAVAAVEARVRTHPQFSAGAQ